MSLADNLKESGKAIFDKTSERIRESSAYAQAADRYESMSPSGQKLTKLALIVLVLFVVLFIPASNLSSSFMSLSLFEEKRDLIRDLFRTYRDSSSSQNIAVPPQSDMLRSSIDNILQRADLLPEQRIEVSESAAEGRLIPSTLVSNVIFVKLAKLNLKQIVDIGASLVGISESVKMKDLSVVAHAQDTRYYDVTYKLYSLKVPEPTPEPLPEPEAPKAKKKSSSKKDSADGEEKSADE